MTVNINLHFAYEGGTCTVTSPDNDIQMAMRDGAGCLYNDYAWEWDTWKYAYEHEIHNTGWIGINPLGAEHGHFWDKTAEVLPEIFYNKYTRRWMPTFHQINQFRGSALYLSRAAAWLMEQANADGLWDWGPQEKDPWGYFGYHSCNRKYAHNRVVDCSMEVLGFLKMYMERNTI